MLLLTEDSNGSLPEPLWHQSLTISISVLGAIATAIAIRTALASLWLRTLGSRRDIRNRLNQLACGTTVDYIDRLFGTPALARRVRGTVPLKIRGKTFNERIYVTKYALVLVLIDELNQAVSAFSVTIIDRTFKYDLAALSFGQMHAVLPKTSFGQTNKVPDGSRLDVRARRFGYSEIYTFGNPGGYQTYILSYNDAGAGTPPQPRKNDKWSFGIGKLKLEQSDHMADYVPSAEYQKAIRFSASINTLTVVAPHIDVMEVFEYDRTIPAFGVDLDRVRLLRAYVAGESI